MNQTLVCNFANGVSPGDDLHGWFGAKCHQSKIYVCECVSVGCGVCVHACVRASQLIWCWMSTTTKKYKLACACVCVCARARTYVRLLARMCTSMCLCLCVDQCMCTSLHYIHWFALYIQQLDFFLFFKLKNDVFNFHSLLLRSMLIGK